MSGHSGSILIVDDEMLNRTLLATSLTEAGHQVDLASDGEQALEMIATSDYDIVLLDLIMPGVDGFTVLEHIKRTPALRHLPVIVISAMEDLDSVVRCIEMGATDYLFKPFDPVLLHARVRSTLDIKYLRDQEMAYVQQLESQLELAARAQRSMLPTQLPQPSGFEFAARFQPARHVGGDFYDVIDLGNNQWGVLLGDVSDKGVHAALFMAMARGLFIREAALHHNPIKVATAVDAGLQAASSARMFVTAIYGILDSNTGVFQYTRAGHDEPLLVSADGRASFLPSGGRALGLPMPADLELCELVLNPGESLIIYSDGVTDMRSPEDDRFGPERLALLVGDLSGYGAEGMAMGVYDMVQAHRGDTQPADDFSLLVLCAK